MRFVARGFASFLYTLYMLGIWLSTIFRFDSYHRLRTLGPWRTFFFACYVCIIGVLVFNVYFAWQVHKQLPAFLQKLPTLTFEQGRLVRPDKAVSVAIANTSYALVFDAQTKNPPSQQFFIDQKILLLVGENHFYMPSVIGVSAHPIPKQLNQALTADFIRQHLPLVRSFLQSMALFGAVFMTGFFLLFSTLLAAAVLLFWRGLKHLPLSTKEVWRWAVLLQGPAVLLWCLQLICGVPLFTFALFILFNIYVQQICNTWPYRR